MKEIDKKAYFLSDLHLGAPYFPDSREAELRVVRFLDSIKDDAAEIYLLGDILDYWYEYRYVVPRGFVRFFGKLAELSDSGIKIWWMIGNHDIWIFDYIPQELGVTVVDGVMSREIMGRRFVMGHGDGLGKLPGSFKFLRGLFRNKTCQKMFSAIHPRWTVPFAYAWSRRSRKAAGPTEHDADRMLRNVREFSRLYLSEHPNTDFFIFGHLHLLVDEKVEPDNDARMIVLGEWIKTFSYGVFDGEHFQLNLFS